MPQIASVFSSAPDIKGVALEGPGQAEQVGQRAALSALPQQQSLIQRLLALSQGQGPSLAQTLLQQQTQQNLQTGASSAASTRGISPALAARLARLTQGNTVQAAAGQGAQARVGEQLGALSGAGGAINNLAGAGNNIFSSAANVRNTQNQQRISQNLGITQAQQAQFAQQQALGASELGGAIGGASSLLGMQGLGGGGGGGGSGLGSGLLLTGGGGGGPSTALAAAHGGQIPSARARLAQSVVGNYFKGMTVQGRDFRGGGGVPGQAKHPGRDTESNDTVPAMLTPGEGVVPLSKMADPEAAADFARQMASERDPKREYLKKRQKMNRGGKKRARA